MKDWDMAQKMAESKVPCEYGAMGVDPGKDDGVGTSNVQLESAPTPYVGLVEFRPCPEGGNYTPNITLTIPKKRDGRGARFWFGG